MPAPWCPFLIRDPGKGAGYAVGHNRMEMVKQHFTAGTDSYNLVKNGSAGAPSTLAQILLPKVGVPWQFTEIDALCYDSGDFNDDGPGIEVERMGTGNFLRPGLQEADPLTPDQTHWLGEIIRWLASEWGVPAFLYSGPRYQTTGWRGHVNHGDLDSQRSDGLTPAEWLSVMTLPTPPLPAKDTPMKMVKYNDTWLQFGVDTGGNLIQSTYDANLVLVAGAQDVMVLGGNRPSSDVTVDVLADQRILVGSEDTNGKNRAINYRPGLGWYDATGAKLP